MSKIGLRTCCVCHNQYEFCLSNSKDKLKPSWHYAYCCENCKDIYTVTAGYENGDISIDEAKEKIDKLDLSNINNFGESYQNTIKKINKNFTRKLSNTVDMEEKAINDTKKDISEGSYKRTRNKNVKADDYKVE